MKYLILMTMAGSMLAVGYLFWAKVLRRFMTESMKYCALVCILFVFAVPWVWLKGIYGYILVWPMQLKKASSGGVPVGMADIVTQGQAYVTPDYRWLHLVFYVWLIVAAVLVLRKIMVYFRSRRRLLSVTERYEDSFVEETMERLKEEFHFKRRVDIFVTPGRNATLTIGMARPVILLQRDYAKEELYVILKHEMSHVVRRDLLLKQLLEFVCCLHWFNPFVYLLRHEFNNVCESSCDERVNRGSSENERSTYFKVLTDYLPIRRAPKDSESEEPYRSAKERVNLVMEAREIKRWKKCFAAGVFAMMMVVSSFTAMAYPDVYHVDAEYVDAAAKISNGEAVWTDFTLEGVYDKLLFDVVYDDQFIDGEGNVYPADSFSPYVFCIKHDIRPGYMQTHVKDGKGGCTVDVYEGTRCTICNSIWVGELHSTYIYVTCPHDK